MSIELVSIKLYEQKAYDVNCKAGLYNRGAEVCNLFPYFYYRRAVVTKAPLRVQFLLTFGGRGEEQEALALLSKKGGWRVNRESAKV